jgi:NitT/TauT family transport system permease protein
VANTGRAVATIPTPQPPEPAPAPARRVRIPVIERKFSKALVGFGAMVVLIALWQLTASLHLLSVELTSSPWRIIQAGRTFYASRSAWSDLAVSGREVLYGFALSLVVGVAVGIFSGISAWFDAIVDPFVNFFYSMPRVAFGPLFVIWFGLGITSKVALIFLSTVFTISISIAAGVKSVDKDLVRMVRSFDAGRGYVILRVLLPASVPSMIAGIRLGIGHALIGMVVAELISSTSGIGYELLLAGSSFQTDNLFVSVITISIAMMLLIGIVRLIERRLSRWR